MRLYVEADCSEHCTHAEPLPHVPCGLCGGEPRTVIAVDVDNLYRFDPTKDIKGIAYLITTGALTLVEVSDLAERGEER